MSSILRFAISDVIAILGLLVFLNFGIITDMWILSAIAVVNMVIAYPRKVE